MNKRITASVVRAARDLIADEAHWTQGSYAATAGNVQVSLTSPRVNRWCLVGAVRTVLGYMLLDDSVQRRLTKKACDAGLIKSGINVVEINESREHADVLVFMNALADAYERKKVAS